MGQRFSQRIKKKPIKTDLQINSMDDDLRIGLWNAFDLYFLRPFARVEYDELEKTFFNRLYFHHLKLPLDTIDEHYIIRYKQLRAWFFEWEWFEVYDFIEFIAQSDDLTINIVEFREFCNQILEKEMSGYRFVDTQITPITDENELKAIEEAIATSEKMKFSGIYSHLQSALLKLSDRKNPDYRNSIKESISAVEAIAQIISGNPKAELGQALKFIEDKVNLHPALMNFDNQNR